MQILSGSISAFHELEVAAYGNYGLPFTTAGEQLPPPPSSSQASNKTVPLGTAISLPVDDVLARMSPNTPAEDALLDALESWISHCYTSSMKL
jgi:hypothetical protein